MNRLVASVALMLGAISVAPLQAAEVPEAARLLPSTSLFYAEVNQPPAVVDVVLEHPVTKKLWAMDVVQAALDSNPGWNRFQRGLEALENRVGAEWPEIVEAISGGGMSFAIEPSTQGAVLLVRAKDEAMLKKTHDALLELVRFAQQLQGRGPEIKESEYRSIPVWKAGEARWAIAGPWLIVTNKDGLGELVLDQHLDGDRRTLADDEVFQQAASGRLTQPGAWSYVRLDVFRALGIMGAITKRQTDNPAAELIAGGVLEALKTADYATASLAVAKEHIKLDVTIPHRGLPESPRTGFYFAPQGEPSAAPLLEPEGTILSASVYRDVEKFWISASELFGDNVMAKFSEAESTLSLFFSGRDFATEVLPDFEPRMRVVVAQCPAVEGQPQPAIRLPGGAVVIDLKEGHQLKSTLTRAFQSFVGIANLQAIQQGNPQLDMATTRGGDTTTVSATFAEEYLENNPGAVPVQYNFRPTIIVGPRHVVFSSDKHLAETLMSMASKAPSDNTVNAEMKVEPANLAVALDNNRESLIAENMLEKGHSREQAATEVGLAIELLQMLEQVSARLNNESDKLQLQVEWAYAP